MNQYRSILPEFDVFKAPGPVRAPPGGQMLGRVPPRRAAAFLMNPGMAAMRGLGQVEEGTTEPLSPAPAAAVTDERLPVWIALAVIGLVGYVSYEIGSAMTPSGGKKTTWGLVGIPLGLFTGPIGLGAMAIAANHTHIGRG